MFIGGISIASLPALVLVWNVGISPWLNSDASPIVGALRYANDQKSQQTLADTLRDTANTLARTNQNVEALSKWTARRDCEDHNRRIRVYTDALKKNPRDSFAIELRAQALASVQALPGCMLESQ